MTNESKKTSDRLIFVHIIRKKHFKTYLENFMTESLNATNTPLTGESLNGKSFCIGFTRGAHKTKFKISNQVVPRVNLVVPSKNTSESSFHCHITYSNATIHKKVVVMDVRIFGSVIRQISVIG
jgi:hypothetical protein